MENKFPEYKLKGKRGVDDLKSESPYYGEWSYFSPYYGITEEEYIANPTAYENRIRSENEQYIKSLGDKFGEEYITTIGMENNSEFDSPIEAKPYPLESYKMLIVDYAR